MSGREIIRHHEIPWPKFMWPLQPSFFDGLLAQLIPTPDQMAGFEHPWDVLTFLQQRLKDVVTETNIHPSVEIPHFVDIRGPVWIEEGARIYPFTEIVGPLYIGKHTIVGNFTQLRESIIGNHCLVGERTTLARTMVADHVSFHQNYLGDSLVMSGVDMGGGGKTANVRLDRANVKSVIDDRKIDTDLSKLGAIIGANSKFGADWRTMPGVKIGANCIVGPDVTVMRDLPDNTRVVVDQSLTITSLV